MEMDLGGAFMSPLVKMQQIEESRANTQYIKAHEQQALAQAAELNQRVESARQMQAIMQRELSGQVQAGSPGTEGQPSLADQFDRLSRASLAGGFAKEARDFSEAGSKLRLRSAQILKNEASENLANERATTVLFDRGLKSLGGVRDQGSMDLWSAMWENITGQASPLRGKFYSPQAVQNAADGLLAAQGKITSVLRERKTALDERIANIREQGYNERVRHNQEMEGIHRERLERVGKTGGDAVKTPTSGMVKEAASLVESEFSKQGVTVADLPPNELGMASRAIASRARALMASNRGIDQTMAIQQAFQEAKSNGDLGYVSAYAGFGKKATFKPQGVTPTMALPMETDPGKRVVGKFYLAPNGGVYQWQKGGWKAAPAEPASAPARGRVPVSAGADDNIDEEDDGED